MELALGESRKREIDCREELRHLQNKESHHQSPPAVAEARPLYVTSRKLEKFRDRPKSTTGITAHEWISDMQAHLDGQSMSKSQTAAVTMEHLAGTARLEVQGRGTSVTSDPQQIFAVLRKVFGDGDSLGQLMSRFFAFQQKPGVDLLGTSLELLVIFQRMAELDPNMESKRDQMLKDRLADVVLDEGLQREIRRLNVDSSRLTYFELRDRTKEWLGSLESQKSQAKAHVVNQEVPPATVVDPIVQLLQNQEELLKSLTSEMKDLRSFQPRRRGRNDKGEFV